MTTTTNMNITHWAASQSQPEVTINEGIDIIDGLADAFVYDVSSSSPQGADYTLATTGSAPYEWQHFVIQITDTASPQVLTATSPVWSVTVPAYPRVYLLVNSTAQSIQMKTAGGAGIVVATNKSAFIRVNTASPQVVARLSNDF